MAFTEDLSVFINPDEFAVGAEVLLGSTGSVIFDTQGSILEAFGVQTTGPAALRRTDELTDAIEGAQIDIAHASGTVRYLVRSATPLDDGAFTLLALADSGVELP